MKRDYIGILLEEIRDQNRAVLEAVGMIQAKIETLATKDEMKVVADDVVMLKFAMTETNKDLRSLDVRVSRIEDKLFAVG
ncbi:MAG TPA: hypothetical protein VHB51_02670 [Candidatus Saccharimonadales bacterium]|nr:hypothetical protein [Candidatus Saccharimonadales bacterium]